MHPLASTSCSKQVRIMHQPTGAAVIHLQPPFPAAPAASCSNERASPTSRASTAPCAAARYPLAAAGSSWAAGSASAAAPPSAAAAGAAAPPLEEVGRAAAVAALARRSTSWWQLRAAASLGLPASGARNRHKCRCRHENTDTKASSRSCQSEHVGGLGCGQHVGTPRRLQPCQQHIEWAV